MSSDPRPTLAAPDDDPRLWLEEVEGARALAWVDDQTARTVARFADVRFASDRDAVKSMLDRPDNIPWIGRRGGKVFNFWKDSGRPRGIWRTTGLESYRTDVPAWEILLDLDVLAAEEGEDWIWAGASTLPDSHDRALLRLSRGGGDATVVREFDMAGRRFVADGFNRGEAKGWDVWLDRDTVLLASALGEGHATSSGYARTVRLWRRGTDPMAAPVIFESGAETMMVSAAVDRDAAEETIVFAERTGFYDANYYLGDRAGMRHRIDLPTDAECQWQRGWMAARSRTEWQADGQTHGADAVVGISWPGFLAGERRFETLFRPTDRQAVEGFFWCNGQLILSYLDELQPRFLAFTPDPSGWRAEPLAGLPEIGIVSVSPIDLEERESNGDLLVSTQDPVTPPSLLLTRLGQPAPTVLKRAPTAYDASGQRVTRHEAISVDGERIPYVQIGPADESGEAPVRQTGYGGFEIPILPSYQSMSGKLWLEKGGTCVIANIRGGGEFGPRWHKAGIRELKARSHDDFAAVAADLVRRGVTRPGRIAAEGGSNGGLLIANMLTRYPERFGALFCTIPLIDMRRYSRLLAGASWIAEYGDPDKPEDWDFLQHVSAYHTAAPGKAYPPILLATGRKDDRVHPGHARKMAAKLQDLGYEAWFYEPAAGGHGYGKDNGDVASFAALGAAFLRRAIGWEAA